MPKKGGARRPRFDPSQRILSRFYEPLVLLRALGQVRGPRYSRNKVRSDEISSCSDAELRRQYLNDLAYCCDYDKGGDTVTAIAIEETPEGLVYWVASNESPSKKIVPFVNALLQHLRTTRHDGADTLKAELIRRCIEFATPRLKKYWSLLSRYFKQYREGCKNENSAGSNTLLSWIDIFEFHHKIGLYDLCEFAYGVSLSSEMQNMISSLQSDKRQQNSHNTRSLNEHIRHYIGRLGYHFSATETLFSVRERLFCLLDNVDTRPIDTPAPSSGPPALDGLTNLDSIVIRMLPKNETTSVRHYQKALAYMDQKFDMFNCFKGFYADDNFRPRVHAEIGILEYFFGHGLRYVENEKFIGCSKPACYCCSLYIQCHPARVIEPSTHQKIYLNWTPPSNTEASYIPPNHQRDMINLMMPQIRKEAFNQMDKQSPALPWHSDSTAGFAGPRCTQQAVDLDRVDYNSDPSASQVCVQDDLINMEQKHMEVSSKSPSLSSDESVDGGVSLTIDGKE